MAKGTPIIETTNKDQLEKAWKRLEKRGIDLLDMFEAFKLKGRTKAIIYAYIKEQLFVKYGIKITNSQVQNRIIYLLKKEKQTKPELPNTEIQLTTEQEERLKEKIREQEEQEMIEGVSITSKVLLDKNKKALNMNKFIYSMISGQELVTAVDKELAIMHKQDEKFSLKSLIDHIAPILGVKSATLYNRYMTNKKRKNQQIVINKAKSMMAKDTMAELQTIRGLLGKAEHEILNLSNMVGTQAEIIKEKDYKLKEFENSSLIGLIKFYFKNKRTNK